MSWTFRYSLASWLAAPLLLGGCVGAGMHGEVVDERNALAQRVKLLEATNESLGDENLALLDGLEDLRLARSSLDANVKELQAKSTRLSKSLTARELELARQHAEVAKLRGTYQGLVSDLEEEVASGQIEIRQLREGLLLNVSDDILFDSGSATVQAGGREVLLKVANRLGKLEHQIQVEGHTDNLAIHGGLANRYPTNWELAGARAASVVRLFREAGIAGERLSAISYAEFQPVAANDSPDERARNRRIEIRLEPRSPDRAQSPSPGVADSADSADAAAPQESSAADPPAPTAQPGS